MIEHSRYELREDDVDLDGGPTSKDLEEMLDRCVLEPDEAIAEEERAIFAEVMSPKTIRKQDSNDSWVEQTLQFFLCGSPRDDGCRVARGGDPEPPPPPPGSPGGPRTPGGGRPGSPPTAARVEARWAAEQIELLRQLRTDDGPDVAACAASLAARDGATWLVAGLDMSYFPDDDGAAVASLVVVELPSRRRVHAIHENVRVEGPYIPGFLAFREAPHYCRLLDRLRRDRPDVVPVACLVDGNGVLRPPARTSNLQPDFNVRVIDGFDASSPTVLRGRDESNRSVQKSAETTSMWPR